MTQDTAAGMDSADATSTLAAGSVLRDVAMHAAPVVLGGRRALRVVPVPAASSMPLMPAAALAPVDADAAFARGLREGRAQGLLEALASAQEDGHRKGYELGLQQGAAKGRLDAEAEVLRQSRQAQDDAAEKAVRVDRLFAEALAQFRAHLEDRLEMAQDDMVDLCCAAVRQILGDEFTDRRQAVGAVRQAVSRWVATGRHGMGVGAVSVLVHPSDLELLQSDASLAEWLLQRGMQDIAWEADHQVRIGGCIVRSATGDLDARFETQLASLHEIVLGARGHDDGVLVPAVGLGKAVAN